MTPEIKTKRIWSWDSVRTACIKNELYTMGDCEEYSHMLNRVNELYPSIENLYIIAADIQRHSDDQTISNIMYILENQAVTTVFEIEGEEE